MNYPVDGKCLKIHIWLEVFEWAYGRKGEDGEMEYVIAMQEQNLLV